MSTMTSPRGPLPARVYWIRRGIALLLALLLVFVVGKVLSGFGGNGGGGARATTVAQHNKATPNAGPTGAGSSAAGGAAPASPSATKSGKTVQPLSVPTGQCADADVTVTPTVTGVDGGGSIGIPLKLTTSGAACTWQVSSRSIVLKVVSGSDRIWSSQDCKASIPTQDVVVRPAGEKAAKVRVTWNGRRSQTDCPKGTGWADPGYYHVVAASLGGAPTDVQFALSAPPRPTVTKTAKPKPKPTHKAKAVVTPKG